MLAQSIKPVVLREQHDAGITIIEKLERYTKDPSIGFGIVLYTPDDEGKAVGAESYQSRARQNVVFEHGLLIGLYGREKVVSLVKKQSNIEMPGDVNTQNNLNDKAEKKLVDARKLQFLEDGDGKNMPLLIAAIESDQKGRDFSKDNFKSIKPGKQLKYLV